MALSSCRWYVFFFQAEDGIRDVAVTGVQTCALPICKFTLLELKIDTGRTHQIRVHLASLGHPVVGDTLYGAPRVIKARDSRHPAEKELSLPRNFLHATGLELVHPRTGKVLSLSQPLPLDLLEFLECLERH